MNNIEELIKRAMALGVALPAKGKEAKDLLERVKKLEGIVG